MEYSGTSINDHLQRATTRYKTAKNSGPDWNYNDFNVKQTLRNCHLSTRHNKQLSSPQSASPQSASPQSALAIENNLPEQTATPRISRKLLLR